MTARQLDDELFSFFFFFFYPLVFSSRHRLMLPLVALGGLRPRLFAFPEATGQYTQSTLRERTDPPDITYTYDTHEQQHTRDTYITIYNV